jgi:hypothetical protein
MQNYVFCSAANDRPQHPEPERSFATLDEPGAQAALDRLLVAFELRQALAAVILPCLRRLGDRWACAQTSVAEEHFASAIISGRLHGLAQSWGLGIVTACGASLPARRAA